MDMPSIAQLWAKAHTVDLEDQFRINPSGKASLKKQIVDIAVKHSLLTKFTAFVIVDESEVINKTGDMRKVVQPAEMPESWEMQSQAPLGAAATLGKMSLPAQGAAPAASAGIGRHQISGLDKTMRSRAFAALNAILAQQQPSVPETSPLSGATFVKSDQNGFSSKKQSANIVENCFLSIGAQPKGNCETTAAPAKGLASLIKKLNDYPNSSKAKSLHEKELRAELLSSTAILVEFFNEFETAFQKLESGKMPDATRLDNCRLLLLQSLATTKLGMKLACLQRFLRAAGIELICSLKDKLVTFTQLQEFWKSKKEHFDNLEMELDDLLSGAEVAFWDSSI